MAKCLALLLTRGGKPQDYYGELMVPGPVLPLIPYDSLDEVLARIETGPKPLAFYLFERDPGTIARLMAELGFRPAGEGYAWRGRARPRPAPAAPTGAFAALAGLVRP